MELPFLPPGRAVPVSSGEVFVRHLPGDDGRLPVLLLHGWMATADLNFFPLYPVLRDAGRGLIAPDLRHHGRGAAVEAEFDMDAAADEVAEVLDGLGVRRAVVVGYSLGTAVGHAFARRHRDRCAGLILCAGALHWRGPIRRLAIWRAGWDGTVQRMSLGRWGGRALLRKAAKDNPELAPIGDWMVGELERGHPGGLRSAGAALARFDARGMVPELRGTVPVEVVKTQRDRLVPPRRQSEMAEAHGVEPVVIDAGHLSPALQPEELARVLPPVIEGVAAAAGESAAGQHLAVDDDEEAVGRLRPGPPSGGDGGQLAPVGEAVGDGLIGEG